MKMTKQQEKELTIKRREEQKNKDTLLNLAEFDLKILTKNSPR